MKDYSEENSMVTGDQYEESTERSEVSYDEARQDDIDRTNLSLTSRVSAAILHITRSNAFDRADLIQLLKDVNITLRRADDQFKSIVSIADDMDDVLDDLKRSSMTRRQA